MDVALWLEAVGPYAIIAVVYLLMDVALWLEAVGPYAIIAVVYLLVEELWGGARKTCPECGGTLRPIKGTTHSRCHCCGHTKKEPPTGAP